MGQEKYDGVVTMEGAPRWTNVVRCHPGELEKPLRWRRPRRVFVNSMGDLFHEDVPFEFVDRVFAVMALCPRHVFQVLTKRPARMAEYLNAPYRAGDEIHDAIRDIHSVSLGDHDFARADHDVPAWPLPNVWLGTSVENQAVADERIPKLLECPAAVRFLSCEPLLGRLGDLSDCLGPGPLNCGGFVPSERYEAGYCDRCAGHVSDPVHTQPWVNRGVDWVIAGGESGVGARPMHPDWVRELRDQCVSAGVPFFFKQWGGRNKKAAGRELDGRTWDEMPAVAGHASAGSTGESFDHG